jgi:8-amino-7-oxononanoate synthase
MSPLNDELGRELDALRARGLDRHLHSIASAQGPRIRIEGRELLNFSSNDYLGLANDPLLKRAAIEAVEQYGVGAGASRLVSGNLEPYRQLEEKLARFKNKQAAIVFGSGYAANVGTISALVGPGDVVILDKLDHASIIDGARQSGATIRVYPHKNTTRLEKILAGATSRSRPRRILIITETVFSMDGDLAPLAEIVALKQKHGAWLMIDEAHATGLYGRHRRGVAEAAGVEQHIDITLGTLSKALGCAGGFVAGSQTLIDYLRNRARSLIYSTALPPATVAAASAAVDFVMSEAGHERRDRLWRNVSELKNGLSKLGVENQSRSPIIPIIIGEESAAVEISRKLYEAGLFVPAIRYPTVPKGKARLRVTVTAAHSAQDIQKFLDVVGATSLSRPAGKGCDREVAPASWRDGRAPHQANLRKYRVSLPKGCYFITTCVEGRRPVLAQRETAQIIIDCLRWLREQGRIRLLGFVVMPDHLHMAVALRSRQECRFSAGTEDPSDCRSDIPVATLAEVMKSLKDHTSHQIRQRHLCDDFAWQPGYYETLLRDRRDFENRLDYMHHNPVRKGLVQFAHDYPHSTAHADYQKEIDWAWLEGAAQ